MKFSIISAIWLTIVSSTIADWNKDNCKWISVQNSEIEETVKNKFIKSFSSSKLSDLGYEKFQQVGNVLQSKNNKQFSIDVSQINLDGDVIVLTYYNDTFEPTKRKLISPISSSDTYLVLKKEDGETYSGLLGYLRYVYKTKHFFFKPVMLSMLSKQ